MINLKTNGLDLLICSLQTLLHVIIIHLKLNSPLVYKHYFDLRYNIPDNFVLMSHWSHLLFDSLMPRAQKYEYEYSPF